MSENNKINYVELPAQNIAASKRFFEQVFAWSFKDYGSEYTAFLNAGLGGGFFKSELTSVTANGAALVVLYSSDLEQTLQAVERGGGTISKSIFGFPGGRRFHFIEPSGNELAVWSDIN